MFNNVRTVVRAAASVPPSFFQREARGGAPAIALAAAAAVIAKATGAGGKSDGDGGDKGKEKEEEAPPEAEEDEDDEEEGAEDFPTFMMPLRVVRRRRTFAICFISTTRKMGGLLLSP